jgi:hypothetical protein
MTRAMSRIAKLFKRKHNDNTLSLKIDGENYTIEKITLEKWYKLQDMVIDDEMDTKVNVLAMLFDTSVSTVMKLTPTEIDAVWGIVFVKFLTWDKEAPFQNTLVFNGVSYGFVELDKISVAEFSGLEIYSKRPKMLHKMLSILYRPIKGITLKGNRKIEKFDNEKCSEREDLFLQTDIRIVFGAVNFFLNFTGQSIAHTLDSLLSMTKQQEMQKELNQLKSTLMQIYEDGMTSYTSSPEKTRLELQKLESCIIDQLSTILQELKTEVKNSDSNT